VTHTGYLGREVRPKALDGTEPPSTNEETAPMAEDLGIISLDQNLADIERPPEIPVGRYVGEIQSIEVKTSGQGNEYFAMRILIPSENIPAEVSEHYEDGAVFFYNRLLVPKGNDRRSLWNLRQFVEKLGLDSNTSEINPNEWMNQSIGVVIASEKNLEGELRSTIRSLFAAEDAPAREEEEDEAPAPAPAKAAAGRGRRR
jgi:signal recognition particle subunit SEC65